MNDTKYGYIDLTDFVHELGEAAGGTVIYGSVDDAIRNCPCVKDCGLVKVSVSRLETTLVRFDGCEDTSNDMARAQHYKLAAERYRKRAEFCDRLAERMLNDIIRSEI